MIVYCNNVYLGGSLWLGQKSTFILVY